ncbi:small multidrug resistance pump [Sporomusaceae bacterium BoRhaA]|nr:small multidrug resistance pump [Pelorhabdus rhamnosifermentans]
MKAKDYVMIINNIMIREVTYMQWIFLSLAILLEVCGITMMKLSEGCTKIVFTVPMFGFYVLSLSMLSLALKKIQVSVAYAIWAGVGIVLITIVGVLFFKESLSVSKEIFLLLILIGSIGLHLIESCHY